MTHIKDALSREPLCERPVFSLRQFGAAHAHAELAVRQFLMVHIGGLSLNRALLRAFGSPNGCVVHPLPAPWRRVIERAGVRVAHWRCRMLWYGFLAAAFLYGARQILLTLVRSVAEFGRECSAVHDTVFFEGLSRQALPVPTPDGRSFDIITWYSKWRGRREPGAGYTHTVRGASAPPVLGRPVREVASAIPIPPGLRAIARFAGWGLAATVMAAVDLVRARWWHALLLSQAALAARARAAHGALATDYVWPNSAWLYRPLWTYEAARQGARVLFFFYSTNAETFKRPDGYPLQASTWNLANWPHYLVWNPSQAAFIRRNTSAPSSIEVVGPTWFHTSARPSPSLTPGAVAVFDVQPIRMSAYRALAQEIYYTPDVADHFVNDVRRALRAAGRQMAFKRKRVTASRYLHGRYRRLLRELDSDPNCVQIDPETAAWPVIEACAAVISMPFTSTALIGREQGKPSIYYVPEYAPYHPVQADDRAAHGILIVAGPEALRRWLAALPVTSATQKTS